MLQRPRGKVHVDEVQVCRVVKHVQKPPEPGVIPFGGRDRYANGTDVREWFLITDIGIRVVNVRVRGTEM